MNQLSDRGIDIGSQVIGNKERGQGIMELVVILPVILLILLGIIEVGRMMITYSSLATASRDAVRYAASVGESEFGVTHYQDCFEIRGFVERLALFDEVDIVIEYDLDGAGEALPVEYCQVGKLVDPIKVSLGSQVVVRVTSTYEPLVPLVPIPPIPITSEAKRTILRDVYIK